jgi:hypothetical protein
MRENPSVDDRLEVSVGAHLFRWEPPDTTYLRYCGDMDGDSMQKLIDHSRRFTVGKPHVFLLVDMAKVGKVSADARKRSGQGGKDVRLRGVAVIGASAPMRLLAGMATRAVDLLHGNSDNPTRFFEREAEARVWIATRRIAIGN